MARPPKASRPRNGRPAHVRRAAEAVVRGAIVTSGWTAIAVLVAIAAFLLMNASRAISEIGLLEMLTGSDWYPTSHNAKFGFLPSIVGSMWITAVGLLLSVPLGVATAVYLSEFAGPRIREMGKSIIEFMAAIPSVVFGLVGLVLLVQQVRGVLDLSSGLTGFTAGLVVGILCLPTIVSISEDALHAVPAELRHGSYALGSTRWQTTYRIVLPAAASGIFAAVMLGLGRAIGETMVVLMLAGNSGVIATDPFVAMRTLTGTIAGEAGEVVRGGLHYSALFTMGLVLFVMTFLVNLAADIVLDKQRRRWSR